MEPTSGDACTAVICGSSCSSGSQAYQRNLVHTSSRVYATQRAFLCTVPRSLQPSHVGVVPGPQALNQQEEDGRQQAAHSAVILQRAEAECRRISNKYTRQREQAKAMVEDFKQVSRS